MKNIRIYAALAAFMGLFAVVNTASAVSLTLLAVNQRSSSGTLSTLAFKTCTPGIANGCYNPANAWYVTNGVTGSTATWSWDGTTLTSSGLFWSTSFLSSNPSATAVISDKVVDLSINTGAGTTSATSYQCIEGNFLINVGANGCLNTSTGSDFANNSSALYNVGGNANCIQRTVGGDDSSTGNPRGLFTAPAIGSCDAVDGAFNLYTVVSDTTSTGGQLVLSNGVPLTDAGTSYLTFQADTVVPAPPAVWLLGTAVAALAGRRLQRKKAA